MQPIDPKLFALVFGTVFVAELGDKTQLATLLYAAKASHPKMTVFLGAAAALLLASALGVLAGSILSRYLNEKALSWAAGLGFIAVGVWTLLKA
jgi:putative Ca2+/H+ antiporter (TMEM165/GDT1 family)